MAVKFTGNGHYRGLSTDTKPVAAPAGYTFFETDVGDHYISDGTYWWLSGFPSHLSNKRIGTLQWSQSVTVGTGMLTSITAAPGTGTATYSITDGTAGRALKYPTGTTTGNNSGFKVNTSLTRRDWNPRMRFRFQMTAAADHTLARLWLGLAENTDPGGDDTLASASGAFIGFLSGGTNFKIFHNDGGVTADYDDDVAASAQALDTAVHEVRIVFDESTPRVSVKWDNNAYVHATTDIPAASTALTVVMQNETNESGVAKEFRLFNLMVQSDK